MLSCLVMYNIRLGCPTFMDDRDLLTCEIQKLEGKTVVTTESHSQIGTSDPFYKYKLQTVGCKCENFTFVTLG